MSFSQLGLSESLLRAVREQGYDTPTPIQAQAIPAVLSGQDVLAAAQTGTGKTAGFTLPLLHRLSEHHEGVRAARALVLTPTRELAAQVSDSVKIYGKHLTLRSAAIFGGVNIRPQIQTLQKGVDIIIATPGRLLDLVSQGAVNLSHIQLLVLDEADRMLDMGFIDDIKKIISKIPKQKQTLLFSATFSPEIKSLSKQFLHHPITIEVSSQNTTADRIQQSVYLINKNVKGAFLSHLIKKEQWFQVLVFTKTKHGANRLTDRLMVSGITACVIHGNKSQSARTKALHDFKKGKVQVLVATDIAARGLDIQKLPFVVNFELPQNPEDYVHRIGRTGRAGAAGHAISLVSSEERRMLNSIEKLINQKIPKEVIENFKPDLMDLAEPAPQRTRQDNSLRAVDRFEKMDSDRFTKASPPARRKTASTSRRRKPEGGHTQYDSRPSNNKPKTFSNPTETRQNKGEKTAQTQKKRPSSGGRSAKSTLGPNTNRPTHGPKTGVRRRPKK